MLRSYPIHTPEDHNLRHISLCQAVQATLATSSLFAPVTIQYGSHSAIYGPSTKFEDSCLHEVFTEAQTHLLDGGQDLEDHLDCLVSIGSMISPNSTPTGRASSSIEVCTDICVANKAASRKFSESHASLSLSGQFCRLETPLECDFDDQWLREVHTQVTLAAEQYLNAPDTATRLGPCFARLSRHQRKN